MGFREQYEETRALVEQHLTEALHALTSLPQKTIYDAMTYSLNAGGKRFRPVLFLQTVQLMGGEPGAHMDIACALEYIHTYSLIHDDLPAMDDDEYRRGKKTNHIVFGEAIAILAGDALLNAAYELLFARLASDRDAGVARAALSIARAAGAQGMIGGQVIDIESEGKAIDASLLRELHACKTGALIEASIIAAAQAMGANVEAEQALRRYAQNIGLAFQISDDILDVSGDFAHLGKSIGSDARNQKTTYVTLYGEETAREKLDEAITRAVDALRPFGGQKTDFLVQLAHYVGERDR